MTISPRGEMFSGDGPEIPDHEAIEELKKDLTSLDVPDTEIGEIMAILTKDPNGYYFGKVGKQRFAVTRGLNNQYFVKILDRGQPAV